MTNAVRHSSDNGCGSDASASKFPRHERGIFLSATPGEVSEFFDRLQQLPSPLKERTFVLCCLTNVLSLDAVNQ